MKEFNIETKEKLEKLNDKRLLSFYKSERKKFYAAYGYIEYLDKQEEVERKAWLEYLNSIKSILDTRGHVEK